MPHSEIVGSKGIRTSPTLIAAYHVLHRLCMPRHPPNALKTLDHSHCQYPSNIAVQRYQQKDQLLEIQSVARLASNHVSRLEQARTTLTNGQSDYIFSSLFHTEHARLKSPQTWFFLLLTGTLFLLNTKTRWWSWTGSNRRPPACKAGALPAELQPLIVYLGGPGRT